MVDLLLTWFSYFLLVVIILLLPSVVVAIDGIIFRLDRRRRARRNMREFEKRNTSEFQDE